jgi:hypothetical protein
MAVKEITDNRNGHIEVTHNDVRLALRSQLYEGVCKESLCLLVILMPIQRNQCERTNICEDVNRRAAVVVK